jgi:integrase
MKLSELIDRYIRYARQNGLKDLAHIEPRARELLKHLGDAEVDQIIGVDLDDARTQLLDGKRGKSTVNKYLATWAQMLKFGAHLGVMPLVTVLRLREDPPRRRREVTAREWLAIDEHLGDDAVGDILRFLRWTGRRLGEARDLTWSQKRQDGLYWETSKSGCALASPISEPVASLLRARTAQRRPGLDLVFHREGKPLVDSTVWRRLRRACDRAGADRVSPHDLRASFITALRRQGVPTHEAMSAVGHSTVAAHARYHVVSAEDHARAVDAATRSLGAEA